MSKLWRPFGLACLLAASPVMTTSALRADTGPSVRVTSAVGQGVVRLDAKANGPFEYTMHHPSPDLYIFNLTGVTASTTDAAQVLGTSLVRSYRLEQYESGRKSGSQLEILVGEGVTAKVVRQGPQEILIVVSKKDVMTADADPVDGPHVLNVALHTNEAIDTGNRTPAIQQITVSKSGDEPEVLVLGASLPKPHHLRLSNPERLVLDFVSARITARRRTSSSISPIRDVRAAQFSPAIARVVIDLDRSDSYAVKSVDGGVAVEFKSVPSSFSSQPRQNADPGTAADAAVVPDSKLKSSSGVADDSSAATTASQAATSSNIPAATDPVPQSSSAQQSQASGAQQSGATQASSATTPPATPVQPSAPAAAASPSVQPAVAQQQPVAPDTASVGQTPSAPAPVPVSAPAPGVPTAIITQQSAGGSASTKYTGTPTSLNFKDLDVLDFFRLIHELSGMNVVVDPDVKGRLTIVLDNVPWDQALDIVLKNFDLDKQVDGNVIRIATKATMKREADEARDLAKAQVDAADLVTTTHVLSYAKAGELTDTVKKFLSSRGDVFADARTNTLIISDIPSVMPVIENLLRELDRRSQQVEIEARVVAANRSFSRELGSQFAFAGASPSRNNVVGGNPSLGSGLNRTGGLPVPPLVVGSGTAPPLATNLGATVATSGLAYSFSSANFALDYLISAAESKGVGKLLSRPKLVAQNNLQSTVKQGTKIPIQTVVNNTITVQYQDVVLELQVTPQITADGTIFMNIHVENTQIDPAIPRVNGIPALDTQSEDTQVTVSDGQTIMMGGIIVSSQRTDIEEVPYVGSLPIIGRLFKHTTVSTSSQELLFFITPRILPM